MQCAQRLGSERRRRVSGPSDLAPLPLPRFRGNASPVLEFSSHVTTSRHATTEERDVRRQERDDGKRRRQLGRQVTARAQRRWQGEATGNAAREFCSFLHDTPETALTFTGNNPKGEAHLLCPESLGEGAAGPGDGTSLHTPEMWMQQSCLLFMACLLYTSDAADE